jgi:hypothetical protein
MTRTTSAISLGAFLLAKTVALTAMIRVPALLGEVAFTPWLLIVGPRAQASAAAAP